MPTIRQLKDLALIRAESGMIEVEDGKFYKTLGKELVSVSKETNNVWNEDGVKSVETVFECTIIDVSNSKDEETKVGMKYDVDKWGQPDKMNEFSWCLIAEVVLSVDYKVVDNENK